MRLYVTGLAAAVALGIGLPGCVAPTELPFFYSANPNGDFPYQFPRIDAQEAAERAVEGAAVGAALGAGLGATIGINPGLGALVGTEIGAPLGAAIGVATAHPLPDYKPIAVPASAVIPQYYDRWPPGYHPPPLGSWTPPPPPE
jgi:hypothetical protein